MDRQDSPPNQAYNCALLERSRSLTPKQRLQGTHARVHHLPNQIHCSQHGLPFTPRVRNKSICTGLRFPWAPPPTGWVASSQSAPSKG
eukprot:scaffold275718_cov19-Tisochrysis_lutea.AAC.1